LSGDDDATAERFRCCGGRSSAAVGRRVMREMSLLVDDVSLPMARHAAAAHAITFYAEAAVQIIHTQTTLCAKTLRVFVFAKHSGVALAAASRFGLQAPR